MQALISIIIPTYNRRNLVLEAIKSALDQTYREIEVIVVDDGSTDGTDEFLKEQPECQEARFRYFYTENKGVCAARNYGMSMSKGEYIQFHDSDDLLMPDKIEKQILAFQSSDTPADVAICFGTTGTRQADQVKLDDYRFGIPCETSIDYVRALCLHRIIPIQTSAPLWRRSFLEKNKGWDESLPSSNDWEYHIRLFTTVGKCLFVPEILYAVINHEGERITKNFNIERTRAALYARKSMLSLIGNDKIAIHGIVRRCYGTYYHLLKTKNLSYIAEMENWVKSELPCHSSLGLRSLFLVRHIIGINNLLRIMNFLITIKNKNHII